MEQLDSHICPEVNWLINLLQELLHLSLSTSPTVFCDNVSTTYICANPIFQSTMKHVSIDFHFVCEQVQQKALEVRQLHTVDKVTDVLTKPLLHTSFQRHFHKLGLFPVTSNLWGVLIDNQCFQSPPTCGGALIDNKCYPFSLRICY